ncbi:MAG: tetraacyldisaccharide 4'-kinase [Acidobacteria bacterium]|nr:tetraacyldisaccharide 4'-kinase [Acidobacteriota bacterium]
MQTFIFLLYRLAQFVGFPALFVYLMARYGKTLPERFGGLPFAVTAPGGIWLHAVSVGEVLSAVELVRALRGEYPDTPIYVSTTTTTGRRMAEEKLTDWTDGVFYTPLDFCFAVRRVLRALRPTLVVILETEIWPNLWRETRRSGARLIVVNGRISDRALPRYERFRWLFRPVMAIPHQVLTQSAQDQKRYIALGATEAIDNGNLKYDFAPEMIPTPADVTAWVTGAEKVLVVASTHCEDIDEDDLVIAAWGEWVRAFPRLVMILAPRKPERFDGVAEKLAAAGIPFRRRTALTPMAAPGVLLLDSMGELSGVFRLADVVVMGGTLARRGGHNILEPALFGKPVVAGPHMENFAEIAAAFTAGGGLKRCGRADMAAVVAELLRDPGEWGARAKALAEHRRGALPRTLGVLREEIERAWPVPLHPWVFWLLLAPLAWLWKWGGRWNRQRAVARRLDTPVVSVGGISMGGAGKTPTVLWLARHFTDPAILTRGYRRLLTEPVTVIPRGTSMPIERTGDEAQIFVRSGAAHVGVGGDRYAVGRAMEAALHPEVFLLDDAFQHYRLAREFDLVLLDARDPFAGDASFPLGRLREMPEALGRASAILLTRTERGRTYGALRARLAMVSIYRSRVVAESWVDAGTGKDVILRQQRVAAFCGLANPTTFWSTLREQGAVPLFRWTFGDHHSYRHTELVRLREHAKLQEAEVLLTTEKDLMNLPPNVAEIMAPVKVFWLRIGMEIEGEAKLVEQIRAIL